VPLWPSLRAVLPPGQPRPNTRATAWSYQGLRPLLLAFSAFIFIAAFSLTLVKLV